MEYVFSDIVEKWNSDGGWYYVRLPKNTYNDLQEIGHSQGRGFGAIKVKSTIGVTTWETSIFPDSKDKSYILFLKKAVRQKEKLDAGNQIDIILSVSI